MEVVQVIYFICYGVKVVFTSKKFRQHNIIDLHNFIDAALLPIAYFNDSRCADCGVYATDPLLFTCELYEVILLQVMLPSGVQESMSVGDTAADVALSVGFTAVSLNITEIDDLKRNISLTLSIANASLLTGGEIRCGDTTSKNVARARCSLHSKLVIRTI